MKAILLYLWQLPQNILGFLLSLGSTKVQDGETIYYLKRDVINNNYFDMGVSLGNYIILDDDICMYSQEFIEMTVRHEYGHQRQSLYLGWFYLLVIGLPSAIGCILSRIFNWSDWTYYHQPWEAWADKLGGVVRF